MAPVADLFNHGSKDEWNLMYTYDYQNKMFLMKACKDIKRGEQIFATYMDEDEPHHTWNQFWIDYGFVSDNNIS